MPQLPSFVELPSFERFREDYLNDDEYRDFQRLLIESPKAGDVIASTGGLRKIRFEDKRRGKGKRGGLRVIYYYQTSALEFLLFTIYDKDEASDLTSKQKVAFKAFLESELKLRYPQ